MNDTLSLDSISLLKIKDDLHDIDYIDVASDHHVIIIDNIQGKKVPITQNQRLKLILKRHNIKRQNAELIISGKQANYQKFGNKISMVSRTLQFAMIYTYEVIHPKLLYDYNNGKGIEEKKDFMRQNFDRPVVESALTSVLFKKGIPENTDFIKDEVIKQVNQETVASGVKITDLIFKNFKLI